MDEPEISIVDVPDYILHTNTIGAGLSAWVHRLDAVAKCYTNNTANDRKREIAVYERIGSDTSWHPNIMRYYGILDNKSVILQFAQHGSIRQYLRSSHSQIPLPTRLRWAEQAADAIAFLHSKGIFHCDISCNNIFLDEGLNVIVGDFAGSTIDQEKCLAWYESGHCYPDARGPSEKTEAFALGSVFYEMLLGKKPFEGMDECTVDEEIQCGRFPDLGQLPALQLSITKCWTQQYESINELLQDVKEARRLPPSPPIHAKHATGTIALTLAALLPLAWWIRSTRSLARC